MKFTKTIGWMSMFAIAFFTSCNEEELINPSTGIPTDKAAGVPPTVTEADMTFTMPKSISPISADADNPEMGRFSLAGINTNGEWLELHGTGEENQNVWLEINGVQKGIKVINGDEVASRATTISKAKADVVFLVDNSGSMSEESNKVAAEIIRWSEKLAETMDVQFGCVGIDHYRVNGALNITDVHTLSAYLNVASGTSRTCHFGERMSTPPADMAEMKSKAANYTNAGGECGGIMLHFADENFSFRENSNRFYVHFTDEPNQPDGHGDWSVLSVKDDSEYYNWSASKGVIYTVWSATDDHTRYQSWLMEEDPCLFSEYTGGQIIVTDPKFNISLDDLPVTGAITQSFVFAFNMSANMSVGQSYDVTITICEPDKSVVSKHTYNNILYVGM